MDATGYEKLGEFYLGKRWEAVDGSIRDELLLYDSKDLTTHAVCMGMTGSGKTGLCLSLIEEAALDGVPVLAVDPKGDLGNLLLSFPQLRPADFVPWIDPAEATRRGQETEEYALSVAKQWQSGLADWGQAPDRIRRFRDAAEIRIYTPGSAAGLPLSVLRSFDAPPKSLRHDTEAFTEHVQSAVSGLLGLLGVSADPLVSREHLLLSSILTECWSAGRDLDLVALIRAIQKPPFDRVGVFDLETFFPARDRMALAMRVNTLIASPKFQTWMQGQPLDIQSLLYAVDGKPRISILSIAHLSDEERMFFVTVLLNELVSWMRRQSGSSSLRAMLYMDEIFGYFPPTANPPSKLPMLTLLKQARAFGVGVVLATQNPGDLDYKGLSNTGTWFIGRLQTDRDKLRVLDGLEGASAAQGGNFDRAALEETLSNLDSRVFLLNNVHEDGPVLFHTRWLLSYLRGPMTRSEIQRLMSPYKAANDAPTAVLPGTLGDAAAERPIVPSGIAERFLVPRASWADSSQLVYRPGLMTQAKLHYVRAAKNVDLWTTVHCVAAFADEGALDWGTGLIAKRPPECTVDPDGGARFESLPSCCSAKRSYTSWRKALVDHLYQTRTLSVFECRELGVVSEPGEEEGAFRGRLAHAARERRDFEAEKLKRRYASKFGSLSERIRRAEARVEKEQSQYESAKTSSIADIGSSILGAVFGRKALSSTNVRRIGSAMRGRQRVVRERQDVERAHEDLALLHTQFVDLELEFQEAVNALDDSLRVNRLELVEVVIRPRKSDIKAELPALCWMPFAVREDGSNNPLFD